MIDLRASRHPVVERLAAGDAGGRQGGDHAGFVPNDVRLDADKEQLLLVTGPNMAGKSTLIRQTALAVVLAQMGSFVPARGGPHRPVRSGVHPGRAPATTWPGANRRSWSRCGRPPTSCATPPGAAW